MKKLIFSLLALLLAACGGKQTASPTSAGDQTALQEQAVYTAVLQQVYGASSFVIMDSTATGPVGVDDTNQTFDYVLQNMHDVDPGTLESFRSNNAKAHPVPADMHLGVDYIVLTQAQRNQIFDLNQSGWETFYNNYPDAPGLTSISRVGFNATFDQALVYVGTQSNYLAGAGYFVLLTRSGETWTVDQKVMTWIS